MSTPLPGKNDVPFWRTIILPGRAFCPPYNLTPRRFGRESLFPFTEPCAFVYAIVKYCCEKSSQYYDKFSQLSTLYFLVTLFAFVSFTLFSSVVSVFAFLDVPALILSI